MNSLKHIAVPTLFAALLVEKLMPVMGGVTA